MLNKVTLIGRIGKDITIKNVGQTQVANLTVYTWHSKFNKDLNKWEKETEWHNVVVWGNAVKSLEKLVKNDYVLVEGEIKTNKWQTSEGTMRSTVNIVGTVRGIHPPMASGNTQIYGEKPQEKMPSWTPDNAPTPSESASTSGNEDNFGDLPF